MSHFMSNNGDTLLSNQINEENMPESELGELRAEAI